MLKYLSAAVFAGVLSLSNVQAQDATVAFLSDLQPFGFIQDGKHIGFDLDLWAEIAKDIGVKYEVVSMDFGAMIPALQTGNIDAALASMFVNDARKQVIDFSDTYYVSAYGVLAHKDDTSIQTVADLADKSIATVTGGEAADWISKNLPNATMRLFPNLTNSFLEFQAGRVDAVIYDYPTLAYYANTDGASNARVLDETIGDQSDVAIAFPKGSELVTKVNESLAKMRKDGRYNALLVKWFGKS
ncbi:transporter substrate-binding domain-containing protein [Shinella zoogloeoides]|uniref:transporter substrate-binding domain-containing protein n=1 Tax=Shinella zoogloeoides TaxID=352475 RepID=UPI00299E2CCD|nr:transporter substrate-binding domain-containing protein [Shinella zoogloeoides]WPE24266.1 Glutamine-binding periplasmic protein [Shinella zoogloeoides]